MKALFISVQALIIASSLVAQRIEWHKGAVVLSNKEVVTGAIYYPKGFDLIFLQTDEGKMVLNTAKAEFFRYYDSAANINRKFVRVKTGRSDFSFYEVVISGEVSVVRKLKRYANRLRPDEIDSYHYFTLYENTLIPLLSFKKHVYPKLLNERFSEIQAYVHQERLNPGDMKSALLIITEFNRIMQVDIHARAN